MKLGEESYDWDPNTLTEIVDSVATGHWKEDWLLELDYAIASTGGHSLLLYLSHFLSFTVPFFSFLFQPAVSFSLTLYSLYLPLQPPCDLPVYLGKQITAAGQELPNVSINIPVRPITTSDWAPADRTVHKWTTALIHSMLFYDKTEPNGFEMSHRLGADMWKWPISSIKDHYSFGV